MKTPHAIPGDGSIAAAAIAADPRLSVQYQARISAKNGRTLYASGFYDTREEAIRDAFAARPRARSCSTCRGVGFDIRWHNNTTA